ncbi:MAG: rod-binding protein [Desulfomonilia bacterium]
MIHDITSLSHIRHTNPEMALEKACRDFESIFVHQLLKTMGESIPDGMLDSSLSDTVYKDMLYMNLASSVVESGGFGVAEMLRDHIVHGRTEDSPSQGVQASERWGHRDHEQRTGVK